MEDYCRYPKAWADTAYTSKEEMEPDAEAPKNNWSVGTTCWLQE